ncbi:fungal-specific transcription factor domain-containing protein [Lineolata rhizophorae]|uniref:Fungal-specific transcription factor domain-containing protein n=1 Tax=Lineolata rhizophorae TaxID=578093 RepID=A0A6A6NTM4_9PEZI|nr:fungal-specific transcription factor domain-containing protein [Lineolata rhizophorae]
MDDSLTSNGISALSASQHQHNSLGQRYFGSQPSPSTLPPLHPLPKNTRQPNTAPQTPMASHPHTPNPPQHLGGQSTSYPPIAPQPSQPPPVPMQPSTSYLQSGPPAPQPFLAPSSTSHPNQPSIAPAPPSRGLPAPITSHGGSGYATQYGQSQLLSQPPVVPTNQDMEPVHVVGSQGRRGVLPSLPGRSVAGTGKTAPVPTKNADGKYPCPHCNRTYLHAKHLKRHMLRHTGDRPYQCPLCSDTFSRSDILKRHFQKCSARRGNPTGATHLSHSQSHLRRNSAAVSSAADHGFIGNVSAPSSAYGDGSPVNGLAGVGLPSEHAVLPGQLASSSARSSRSNSLMRPAGSGKENRRSLPNMSALTSVGLGGFDESRAVSAAASGGMPQPMQAFHTPHGLAQHNFAYQNPAVNGTDMSHGPSVKSEQHDMLYYGRPPMQNLEGVHGGPGENVEWGDSFQSDGQDGFMMAHTGAADSMAGGKGGEGGGVGSGNFQPAGESTQESMFGNMYPQPSQFGADPHFPWNLDPSAHDDPMQNKADALVAFCLPKGTQPSNHSLTTGELKTIFTKDNAIEFLNLFANWQSHWPMIHIPTFNPYASNDGLVSAMMCAGAVYSDRLSVHQVRKLINTVKDAIYRSSRVYNFVAASYPDCPLGAFGHVKPDIEEIQSLILLLSLLMWHGNNAQRCVAMEEYPKVAIAARMAGLLRLAPPNHPAYSILHQSDRALDQTDASSWQWEQWTEQETRVRIMYLVFLIDAAMAIYFNYPPSFDICELQLPLPADDATWEAATAADCADALGLHGPEFQIDKNTTGSRRPTQMNLNAVVAMLMDGSYKYGERLTNPYSKFIVIHALHALLWRCQSSIATGSGQITITGYAVSGPGTPLSQNEWPTDNHSGSRGSATSGAATPNEGGNTQLAQQTQNAHHLLKRVALALENWKAAWDGDMMVQYPPTYRARRVGFCRDGIYFYWLAIVLLRGPNRQAETQLPPDTRCFRMFQYIKKIKVHVAMESGQRGLDVGSMGEIDDSYGVEDLTLDMKLLFAPISSTTKHGGFSPTRGIP